MLPRYLLKEGVVALGEIGYDDQTPAEDKYYRAQLDMAKELDMVVMVHTPHRDKKTGTIRSMEVAVEHGIAPGRVIIDHNNEETVEDVLNRGFWAAFTLYPHTKMGNERMVEIARRYGSERIFIDSSSDWGVSDPLAVPKTAQLMLERGIKAGGRREDLLRQCARGLRPERADDRDRTGSTPRPSTSALCSKATPCCAGSRRAWTSCSRCRTGSRIVVFK